MLTRDHVIWTVLTIGGAAGYIAGHFDRFPFITEDYQGTVELVAFLCTLLGAKAGMSPLPRAGTGDKIDLAKVIGR